MQALHFVGRKVPFDLHVLSTPPAFILSQDQTLDQNFKFVRFQDHLWLVTFFTALGCVSQKIFLDFSEIALLCDHQISLITFSRFSVLRRNYIKIASLFRCVKNFFKDFKIFLKSLSGEGGI